jgi:hypothetical protein
MGRGFLTAGNLSIVMALGAYINFIHIIQSTFEYSRIKHMDHSAKIKEMEGAEKSTRRLANC